jgi:hypothetical protein
VNLPVPQIIYLLCALTSATIAVLLLRRYVASGARLLLWAGICFVLLAGDNSLLFVDLALLGPDTDLRIVRMSVGLAGLCCLLFGLIWDAEKQ